MKKILCIALMFVLLVSGCARNTNAKETVIALNDDKIQVNGKAIAGNGDVFASHDIIYYEDKDVYESGNPYGEGTAADMHTKEEADKHTVINITKSGVYRISGNLSSGQIRVDLGEDAKTNPDAVVELILDNADITCSVAPAILFMNVYECDEDASADTASPDVDTSKAGAVLTLADGSKNNINGSYVAKIFKDTDGEKKLWKQDGAIYSYMSMNISGEGEFNLNAANEGIDTEMHLTINSGNINISSQNDGINTNEDNISVTTINGGNIKIIAGLGAEGDGIDSNGWLVINGGKVVSRAKPISDSGLDSNNGSFINGGTVVAIGSTMDWPESESGQVTMNLQLADTAEPGSTVLVKSADGKTVFEHMLPNEEAVDEIGYSGIIMSCPDFEQGEEYTLYINGVKYGYYGSDIKMQGKKPNGKKFPGPDSKTPGFKGEKPPMIPRNRGVDFAGQEQKTVFVMTDKVNLFTGVSAVK